MNDGYWLSATIIPAALAILGVAIAWPTIINHHRQRAHRRAARRWCRKP